MRFPILALVLSLSAALPARGEDPPALSALIAEALERSPDVRVARESAEAASQRINPASALPDPMLTVNYENDGSAISLGTEPMSQLQFMAQQTIPLGGKRRLAGQAAGSQAAEVATRIDRARLGVEASVRRAWASLVAARESIALTDEQIATWKEIGEITRSRYAAGMGSQQDLLRAQGERTRLEQQRVRDEAAEELARVELSRILLRPVGPEVAPSTGLIRSVPSLAVPDRKSALEEAEAKSPELREARLVRERTAVEVTLAKKGTTPDLTVQAGYGNRGSLPMTWSAGVGITVPVWSSSKQKPLVAGAEAQARAAKETEDATRARLVARTSERLVRLSQLARETRIDEEGILVQDRLSVDAALASYTSGSVPFVTVLEALGTLYADRRAAVSRVADFLKTDADLRELSLDAGGSPVPAAAGASAAAKM